MRQVVLDPLLAWPLLAALGGLAAVLVGYAVWRRLPGWWLRGLAGAALLAALANPSLQTEERDALSDIVILVLDESASQRIADRPAQTEAAREAVEDAVARMPNTELRTVTVGDDPGDGGTLLATALAEAVAGESRDRIAGAILVTDGRLHDLEAAPDLPAPLHALLTGRETDWDRRLLVTDAPAFAILGEPVTLRLRVEDEGRVPETLAAEADLAIAVDGGEPQLYRVPVGEDLELPVVLPHGGANVIQFTLLTAEGELTDRNNSAAVQINGVRDRLRVLLVSGEPHPGERTWRNLLKSDASVDLVHFTILRPPEKQDGVPVTELSLIAFPTRELFLDKIDEFDLIIFDRYRRRGILPSLYLDNVRAYVEAGGALLVAAGPDFATAESIYRSPLSSILPAAPTGLVIDGGFVPALTDLGARHPVTAGLEAEGPGEDAVAAAGGPEAAPWGRWMRAIDLAPEPEAEVVMQGPDERPLLVLDRVGEGRVALLGSDHAWLWSRGFEAGGPQLELLRRLAHWLMQEPELEEEALTATAEGQRVTIERRTLGESVAPVEITGPGGESASVTLEEVAPGRFVGTFDAPEIGLYRLKEGEEEAVVALGPSAPREFERTLAGGEALEPLTDIRRGGIHRIEDGLPDLRRVGEGRPASGRGWIGITPREAYVTADIRIAPLLPAWAWLLLASLLAIGAWLREGRR